MTIDESIKYYLDIADGQDKCAEISVSEHAKERISQCTADHRQLAEWLTELKELRSLKTDYVFFKAEAKKLLKAAVEDFSNIDFHIFDCDGMCDTCPLSGERDHCLKWRYCDEAEKLLKED